jgi:BirA family biotin operon repressor/biotin-[acetyl-CoA-carboxylase] ligase
MVDPIELLRQLSDGAFYSGQKLAAQYGVSRMTIYHSMSRLTELGVALVRVRGRGYRLSRPIDLLDERIILSRLEPDYAPYIGGLEVFPRLDSTSSYLLRRADQGAPGGLVCLAEYQTAGKGRRGRRWVSPFGSNLYLSLLWRFDAYCAELSGLSLLVGLAVAGMIRDLGGKDVCLKWPNDIICHRQKLGGILLEMSGETAGRCHVVIGVGLNVSMPMTEGQDIDQPWTDMANVLCDTVPSRNDLAASLIESLLQAVLSFERKGLQGLVQAWRDHDCLYGRSVTLHLPIGVRSGKAVGVDALGRLRLECNGVEECFSSGEISVTADI